MTNDLFNKLAKSWCVGTVPREHAGTYVLADTHGSCWWRVMTDNTEGVHKRSYSRLARAGLILTMAVVLAACTRAETHSRVSPSPTTDPTAIQALESQMREARAELETKYKSDAGVKLTLCWGSYPLSQPVPLFVPTQLSSYIPERPTTHLLIKEQDNGNLVEGGELSVRLARSGEPDTWIELRQAVGCTGGLLPVPDGATKRRVDLPNLDAPSCEDQVELYHGRSTVIPYRCSCGALTPASPAPIHS